MTDALGATLVTDLQSGRPLLRSIRLEVIDGVDVGRAVSLEAGTVLVGTGKDADLALSDRRVSRVHVEVHRTDDGVRVRDAGSRNGVLVGGARVSEARVPVGACFVIGATTVAVVGVDTPVELPEGPARFGPLVSVSSVMRRVHALLVRAAASDVTVLLEGETGVGKEVIARALHAESKRKRGPFLVVDCGALSRELLSSELFGHRRGAFTGAVADRQGLFEAAAGGTIFLDEIGELPLDLQPALLRVLDSRQVRRLGDTDVRPVDVRVIAATHRDLSARVRDGAFREDLSFRLAVLRVRVPALRERMADLPALCERILTGLGTSLRPTPADLAQLLRHRWPGNVRELRNVLEQAVALGDDALRFLPLSDMTTLPPEPRAPTRGSDATLGGIHRPSADEFMDYSHPEGVRVSSFDDLVSQPFAEARAEALARFERVYVTAALARAGGNVARAADEIGLARTYLHRVLRRAGVRGRGKV